MDEPLSLHVAVLAILGPRAMVESSIMTEDQVRSLYRVSKAASGMDHGPWGVPDSASPTVTVVSTLDPGALDSRGQVLQLQRRAGIESSPPCRGAVCVWVCGLWVLGWAGMTNSKMRALGKVHGCRTMATRDEIEEIGSSGSEDDLSDPCRHVLLWNFSDNSGTLRLTNYCGNLLARRVAAATQYAPTVAPS